MNLEPIAVAYAILYLIALALAYWNRKSFPLGESLLAILIIGVGFTGVVYASTLWIKSTPIVEEVPASQFYFTLAYLALVAVLLVYKVTPQRWKDSFVKANFAELLFKLPVFVILPIILLRQFWNASWQSLGFSWGDVPGQLIVSVVLILLFGGFNLFAGSGAAPLRGGQFSGRQIALGVSITFLWNIIEVGLVEEFFFRGFIQTRMVNYTGSALAGICLASLLFGLAHAPGMYLRRGDKNGPLGEHPSLLNSVLYAILILSPAGWFTGLLYWKTQSLLAPVLLHAAIDTVVHASDFIAGLKLRQ